MDEDIPIFDLTPFGQRILDEEYVPGPKYDMDEDD